MGTPERSILTSAERARQIAFVLWVTLALNWVTALIKILFGMATQCMVITADGFHSLSDGACNIIGLVAVAVSGHPADKDHPYGHHKFETLASVLIGALLLVVSFGIFQQAVNRFFHPGEPEVSRASFFVMVLTLGVNFFVVVYERAAAKKFRSEFLLSDSWHTLTDVFVTCGVMVGLVGIQMKMRSLDSLFSAGIATLIAFVAIQILKQSTDILTDKAVVDPGLIERVALNVAGVEDCHEIRTRGKAHSIYVDLHVLVDPKMSVEASHGLANQIEYDIKKQIEGVQDVVVHIEPTTHDHSKLEN